MEVATPLGRENHIGQVMGADRNLPQGTPGEEEAGLPIYARMTPGTQETNHHPFLYTKTMK